MSDLYNGIHEYNSNDIGGLILPTSFEDALSYDQQILWLYLYKQALLQAGENIELHENADGTVTISATSSGATYTIRSTTPDSGFGSAYELVDVDTGERAGSKINIPEAIDGVGISSITFKETDAQGNNVYTVNLTDGSHYDIVCPRGLQGVAGQDGHDGQDGQNGTNGTDGVGITSITFKETDAQGNNIYTVNLTNSTSYDITCPKGPQGATGPAGAGVPTGGTKGQVLSKVSGTDYDTQWRDVHEVPSGGGTGQVLTKVNATNYKVAWRTLNPSLHMNYLAPVTPDTQKINIIAKGSENPATVDNSNIDLAFAEAGNVGFLISNHTTSIEFTPTSDANLETIQIRFDIMFSTLLPDTKICSTLRARLYETELSSLVELGEIMDIQLQDTTVILTVQFSTYSDVGGLNKGTQYTLELL